MFNLNKKKYLIDSTGSEKHSVGCDAHHADPLGVAPERVHAVAGLDLEKLNGKNGKNLPVPAVYIIDKEATVTYRFFNQDYKKRPSVKEILDNL